MLIYHGSDVIVSNPKIKVAKFHKDFYFGFYTTKIKQQAIRWATRFGDGYISIFEYIHNTSLKTLIFNEMTEEWLDFIVSCRSGIPHDYDIVEGPMADDQIYNYIQGFLDGKISREVFWGLAKFRKPTHQISFNTERALQALKFITAEKVYE